MNLKMMLLATTASLGIGSAAAAFDQALIDAIASDLAGQGYTRMEVKITPNGAKIEASGPNGEIERLYDNAGNLLKEERDGESGSTGSDDGIGSVSSDDSSDDLYDDSDDSDDDSDDDGVDDDDSDDDQDDDDDDDQDDDSDDDEDEDDEDEDDDEEDDD